MTPQKISILRDRGHMLGRARKFFQERNVLEVDCPLITKEASIDAHIDLIPIQDENKEWRYLHSSPEYGMKRLLAQGLGDIYQLAHVFRQGEESPKHNPEFTMAEWYRMGISFETMIEETVDFVRLFLGPLSFHILNYREAFLQHTGIDYLKTSIDELMGYCKMRNLALYQGIENEGRDALLNLILGSFIEPLLGKNELCVLAYYPSTQAALAKTLKRDEETVAERFEIYYKGIELANGYHELVDAKEQRQRLQEANQSRIALGKNALPIDEKFLSALESGLPDACGVAVGFDRLMMLKHGTSIQEVIPFSWQEA